MPGEAIGEFILRPLFELVLHVLGYLTGRIVVPLFSMGTVRVMPIFRPAKVKPKWHGFHRGPKGNLIADCDTATLIGLVFWLAVGIFCYVAFGNDAH